MLSMVAVRSMDATTNEYLVVFQCQLIMACRCWMRKPSLRSHSHPLELATHVLSFLRQVYDGTPRETPAPSTLVRCICCLMLQVHVIEVASYTWRACLPTTDQLAVRSFYLPALTEMSHSPIKRI